MFGLRKVGGDWLQESGRVSVGEARVGAKNWEGGEIMMRQEGQVMRALVRKW